MTISRVCAAVLILLILGVFVKAFKPLSSFLNPPHYFPEEFGGLDYPDPIDDRPIILLVADNKGTEIFDLLAPYYLFAQTGRANVFIVAKDPKPVPLFRGLTILPQHSFASFNALKVKTDVIIIPNLSTIQKDEIDDDIVEFIKSKYVKDSTLVVSICDGAATAAKTGIYRGAPITTHSSDLAMMKKQYPELNWVSHSKVVKHNNLYSTAGVSNATQGSLLAIRHLFDSSIADKLQESLSFSYDLDELERRADIFNLNDKLKLFNKVAFSKNKKLGFLITENISEFHLAALMDTYSRTFPKDINTISINGKPIRSLNGLTFIPTASSMDFDELHFFQRQPEGVELEKYGENLIFHRFDGIYIFDYALTTVEKEYGKATKKFTKKLLDYENY